MMRGGDGLSHAPSSSSVRVGKFGLGLISLLLFDPFLSQLSSAYDGYREGYLSEFLPGSPEDARGLPNLPLVTDTNRY